jgi:predicted AlkP superfamily pyrophosphatase or phosphodiesterase
MSPRNLTASTFGDEIILASGGRSRVFSISIKDRGAILPGGNLGKAFWYSSSSGQFVTSTYYYREYPAWVTAWNKAGHAAAYKDKEWTLLQDRSSYIYGDRDDEPWEKSYKKLGRTFPHPLGNEDEKAFYAGLRYTPMGDELTLAFVKELVDQEKLGTGPTTDVLAVSFSVTDYIGHAFGPDSLESEDNLLRLDRTLADFFEFLDKKFDLDNVVIELSSDHGVDSVPERTQHFGLDAGRHRPNKFIEAVNEGLKKRFNIQDALVKVFWNPSLYLDLEAVSRAGLQVETVEAALREEILKVPGVRFAATRTDLLKGDVTSEPMHGKLQRAFHPTRSGNVLFVQDVGWYLYPNPDEFAAMHGSPYTYDTYVPIMFAGHKIRHDVVDREVAPEDIASTITTYLGIKPPSGSTGTPLVEVFAGLRD